MVARSSPDWIPSGWTIQFKVLKSGRKIRFYTNLETGKKFYSKDKVIHYIKVSSSKGIKSQPTNRNIKRHSRNGSKPPVVKTNEHPEWLPKGWNVEVKTRNSGPKIGAKYKCYLDPLTGCKFYSKPQVFQYLKTVKLSSRKSIKRKPDIGLPLVVVEKCTVEDLPAGWIKEIKIRKNSFGIRKDPYYTDPRSGYKFRSKKDVFRYLETGEISRNAFKPKDCCINNEELINGEISPSTAPKRQKLNHPGSRRRLCTGKGSSDKDCLESAKAKPSRRGRANKVSAEHGVAFTPTAEVVIDKNSVGDTIKEPAELLTASKGSSDNDCLESAEAKSSRRGRANKVSAEHSVAFAPTAEIVTYQNSLGDTIKDPAETMENSNPGRSKLPKTDGSKRRGRPKSLPVNDERVLTPVVDIQPEKNDVENMKETRSTMKNLIDLNKSKKKKEFNLPCRSSKRLAGLEPEQVFISVSSQQAFPVSTRKFSDSGAGPDAGLAPYSLSNGASEQPKDEQETVNEHHASIDLNNPLHEEPSEESKQPLENQAASKDQLEMLETETVDGENPEQQPCCQFGISWSDPCLDFAIKTLTGALPLEDTTNKKPVLTPAAEIQPNENTLEGGIQKSSNRRTQVNLKNSKNKNELNVPPQSSNRLGGFEPELVANSISSEQALQDASIKPRESEATAPVALADGASQQQLDAGLDMEPALHASTDLNTPVLGESPNKSKEPVEAQGVSKDQPQMPKSEIMLEPQLSFPFGDSWLDPCLEFAFKTLTGAIPLEDNMAIPGSFQEQLDISQTQRDSSFALPDFGLPSSFQNDISFNFDSTEKSVSGNETPGNVSLPSCSGIGSQQPCLEGNKDLHGNVNS